MPSTVLPMQNRASRFALSTFSDAGKPFLGLGFTVANAGRERKEAG